MSFSRKKGISAAAALILLALFNVLVFLLPMVRGITFWLGYSFVTLAVVLFAAVMLFLFDSEDKKRTFLRLPLISTAWIYLILQTIVGLWQIFTPVFPYVPALIINGCLAGFFLIILLASKAAGESIEKQEAYIAEKVYFINNMQLLLSSVKTDNEEVAQKIHTLSEDIKFSDPMSHSMLSELEKQIEAKIVLLKSDATDKEKAMADIEGISDLLKERNQKCRMLKNVKEEKKAEDSSGVKYVAVTVGVLGALATVALVICFVIVPNNTYKTAMSLYENEQYTEARVVFESLNGYSDSNEMIEACKTAITEQQYLDAQKLYEEGKYDEAIQAFESLGTYKDSKEMIESVKQTVTENKYIQAEDYFESQNYLEAMKLYTELGDYKDCKQKIEQIQNRLATDNAVYYGTYQNQPIAWRVLQTEDDRMLLIAQVAICELPYNDEIKDVTWQESSLCSWLNNEFIDSFSEEQLAGILTTDVDGADCKVYLLSKEEAEDLEDESILSGEKDWWLRTKADVNAVYVTASGEIVEDGETVVRAKCVRPCIWIDLK